MNNEELTFIWRTAIDHFSDSAIGRLLNLLKSLPVFFKTKTLDIRNTYTAPPTTKSISFPLRRLSYVALQEVFKHMDLIQLIELSLCSKKCIQLVKIARRNKGLYIRLTAMYFDEWYISRLDRRQDDEQYLGEICRKGKIVDYRASTRQHRFDLNFETDYLALSGVKWLNLDDMNKLSSQSVILHFDSTSLTSEDVNGFLKNWIETTHSTKMRYIFMRGGDYYNYDIDVILSGIKHQPRELTFVMNFAQKLGSLYKGTMENWLPFPSAKSSQRPSK
ncbi:unnamed protein product [Caenorhabditis brenneri]